jgi:DNA repair protein SbcC/Rad50
MKIKKIILKNFCSHKNTEIEFDDSPITVITGDTGAGKSSILDGLAFAIYQKVPRYNDKEVNKVRFEGATEPEETKAEVYITKDDKELKITRILRASKDNTYESLLEINNQKQIGTKKKIDEEIINLTTGVNFDIFSRTIILPQGKFADFLKADSPEEKREIIKGIFPELNIYSKIEEEISTEFKEVSNLLELKRREIESLKNQIERETLELKEILRNLGIEAEELDTILEETKKLYEEKIKNFDEESNKIRELLESYKLSQRTLSQILELEKNIKNLSLSIERDISKLKEVTQEVETSPNLKDTLIRLIETKNLSLVPELTKLLKNEIENLNLKVSKLLQDKAKYESQKDNYKNLKKEYEEIKKEIGKEIKEEVLEVQEGVEKLNTYILKLQKELETLNSKINQFDENKLFEERTKLSRAQKDLEELEKTKKKIELLEDELKEKDKKLNFEKSKLEALLEEEKTYKNQEIKYYSAYIRDNLKEGDTCPVCGNTFSLEEISKESNIISKDLKVFKEKIEEIREKIEATKRETSKIEGEINNLTKQIETEKLEYSNKISELSSKGISSKEDIKKIEERLENESQQLRKTKEERDRLDKEIHRLNTRKEDIEKRFERIKQNEAELKKFRDNLLEKLNFLNYDSSKSPKLSLFFSEETHMMIKNYISKEEEKLKTLQLSLELLNEISVNQKRLDENETMLKNITKDLSEEILKKNIEEINKLIEENEAKLRELQKSKEEMSKLMGIIESKIKTIKDRIKDIESKDDEKKNLEKDFDILSRLKERFKANEIINFVTKVKMLEIVEVANEYLKMMGIHDKRLEVNITSNSLDFEVVYSDGNKNTVKSLSGGESFLFSIALAFSVSNEILSKNSVKTLFIDEGFDTLDEGYNSKLFHFLEMYSQERDVNIFIITHKREISENTNYKKYLVYKEGNISKVKVIN